ncbi:YceK/YidQ family lipoprotein [Mycolicibacterium grossiae]|nr:YceK/YidQ family lipoprotein [Mycolicibacterium grossiae]
MRAAGDEFLTGSSRGCATVRTVSPERRRRRGRSYAGTGHRRHRLRRRVDGQVRPGRRPPGPIPGAQPRPTADECGEDRRGHR